MVLGVLAVLFTGSFCCFAALVWVCLGCAWCLLLVLVLRGFFVFYCFGFFGVWVADGLWLLALGLLAEVLFEVLLWVLCIA